MTFNAMTLSWAVHSKGCFIYVWYASGRGTTINPPPTHMRGYLVWFQSTLSSFLCYWKHGHKSRLHLDFFLHIFFPKPWPKYAVRMLPKDEFWNQYFLSSFLVLDYGRQRWYIRLWISYSNHDSFCHPRICRLNRWYLAYCERITRCGPLHTVSFGNFAPNKVWFRYCSPLSWGVPLVISFFVERAELEW